MINVREKEEKGMKGRQKKKGKESKQANKKIYVTMTHVHIARFLIREWLSS